MDDASNRQWLLSDTDRLGSIKVDSLTSAGAEFSQEHGSLKREVEHDRLSRSE